MRPSTIAPEIVGECEMKKTTFSPLSGDRYKCNQTGQIVSKRGAERLRRERYNAGRPRPPAEPMIDRSRPLITLRSWLGNPYWICTKCHERNNANKTGKSECWSCKAPVNVVDTDQVLVLEAETILPWLFR